MEIYDLIIIGAGPAGLTASIYASCFHLKHLVVGAVAGGQMINAPDILNYPGCIDISGKELTNRMVEQVKKRGGEVVTGSVTKMTKIRVRPSGNLRSDPVDGFEVETLSGNKYQTRAIILATGTERRKLNIPGEVEYTGRGVLYCATCERQDYEGKICAVVGGGNSAVQAAVELADAAKKVYIIYRGTELRGEEVWLEQIKKNKNIETIFSTVITEIVGDGEKMTGVKLKCSNATMQQCKNDEINIDKIFIEIGGVPGSALIIPLGIKMNKEGYIDVNEKLGTNVAGIFACGDLISSGLSIEQIATAVGLGARAAASAFAYIKEDKAPVVWGTSQIKR